jgi:hypothetical protein
MSIYYNGHKIKRIVRNGVDVSTVRIGKELTRLVEGDDFASYPWLMGDGTAYIDTLHNLNEDLDWETQVDNLSDRKCLFWRRFGSGSDDGRNTMVGKTVDYYQGLRVANNSSEININPFAATNVTISTQSNTIVINGDSHQVTKGALGSKEFRLFYSEFVAYADSNNVKCAYFRFIKNNATIMNLTPCRLLHAIPASLDGNGIARQADECGMYDAVSGKFYGNVASSGTFTVSNE